MSVDEEMRAYVLQRNRLLQSDDPADWRRLFELAGEGMPSTPEVLELSVMKARTAVTTLPMEVRKAAADWLRVRGSTPMADDLGGPPSGRETFKPMAPALPMGWRLERDGDDGALYYHTGGLRVITSGAREADGRLWLHVSCSRASRLPSWEDLRRVKDVFIGPDTYAAQIFPPQALWVNLGPNVLHLFAPFEGAWPLPEFSAVRPGIGRTI